MSSRTLGEDTNKVRESLGSIEIDGDYVAAIKGKYCKEQEEMLQRSAIAIAASSQSSSMIMNNILSQGVHCLKIKSMGGLMHLIVFDTFEDKKAMMESKWLEQWFLTIRNVNNHSSSLWRETWLKIYEMPIAAWGYENFYNVGCIFEKVISVNYKFEFDCAYVLVITDCLFEINGKVSMEIDENHFPIFVSENKGQWELPKSTNLANNSSEEVRSPQMHVVGQKSAMADPVGEDQGLPIIQHGNSDQLLPINDCMGNPNLNNSKQPETQPPHYELSPQKSAFIKPVPPTSACPSPNQTCSSQGLDPHSTPVILSPIKPKKTSPRKQLFTKSPSINSQPNNQILSPQTSKPKNTSPQEKTYIPTYNKFGALIRNSNQSASSSGNIGSSSESGPIFPPGFEDRIPNHTKQAQLRKRQKKLEKKKKKMSTLISSPGSQVERGHKPNSNVAPISVNDIIDMADMLGLFFEGSKDELRRRIQSILKAQMQDWAKHQQYVSHAPIPIKISEMILISWNVRGLNARIKKSSLRKLISSHDPKFIFIQETKIETFNSKNINSIWKDSNVEWLFSPSNGNSGGLLTLWKKDFFVMESHKIEKNWIAIVGSIPSLKFKGCLINVYNPCCREERVVIWDDLVKFHENPIPPSLFLGDFNEVLNPSERGSSQVSQSGVEDFQNFINKLQLIEIPAKNGWFTWYSGKAKSKLDRLLVNVDWITAFPSLQVSIQKRGISDHCPLLILSKEVNWGPRPFRFQNCWLSHPGCMRIIQDIWKNSAMDSWGGKLRKVKGSLKEWNLKEFGQIDQNIAALEDMIHDLDMDANSRTLTDEEIKKRREAQMNLWTWLKRKEMFWAQNSRAKWVKEGDRNTRYFHTLASIRKRKNSITSLSTNGFVIDDPAGLKEEAISFFSKIFSEEFPLRPSYEGLEFKQINADQAAYLTAPFSHMEIDNAIDSCNAQKAPGPDGYNFRFIKEAWEVIKHDVYNIVEEFWRTSSLPKGSNVAFIALIVKCEHPEGFMDFRPISMVGCIYKILAKLLSRRLQGVMNSLIGPHQSSFIAGRQILDGALIAGELIDSCKREKIEATILKLDFHKAFDSVAWSFLEWTLIQMGFPRKWISWILSCVTNAAASILINGSPTRPFKLHRGLRQGDPLSPFLFDLIIEVLSLVIQKATALGCWEGVEITKGGAKLTHLQYADDTIIFCPPKIEQLLNIKKTLITFQLASGLQINFHKISLHGINTDDDWLRIAANTLLCKTDGLPFTYLGLPIGGRAARISTWDPIITRIERKLATWKGGLLSMAGRLTLIKASVSSLPIYFMSLFPVPQGIIEKINQLQRRFLWSGDLSKSAIAMASWKLLELPKFWGGLNCGSILHRNLSLLFKWVWRFINEPQALWHKVISDKYGYSPIFLHHELTVPRQGGPWRNICATILKHPMTKNMLQSSIKRRVGNGATALFWLDQWLGDSPLKNRFPRLFRIATKPNANILSCGQWEGSKWRWDISWCRDFRPRDEEEWAELQPLLSSVCLSVEKEDTFSWSPSKEGLFSVKSLSLELAKVSPLAAAHTQVWKKIWRGLIPPKLELFTWLALRGKLNTKDKLVRMKILPPDDSKCILCLEHQENIDHLLLHCTFSRNIWLWWLNTWRLQWVFPGSLFEAFHQWALYGATPFMKRVWEAMFPIIIWSIWKERNSRIFRNISCSSAQIQDLIISRLCWWIKGWGSPFPYSCDEVIRNPHCLAWGGGESLIFCLNIASKGEFMGTAPF